MKNKHLCSVTSPGCQFIHLMINQILFYTFAHTLSVCRSAHSALWSNQFCDRLSVETWTTSNCLRHTLLTHTHTPSVSADVKSGLCGSSSRNVSNLKKTFQYFKGNINKKKEQMSFLLNVIWLTVAEVENDTMRYKHWYIMRGWCFPTPAVIFSRFFCPLCCSGAPQRRSVALLKTFFFFFKLIAHKSTKDILF